ncbi:hypothetical protein GLOIN_2v1474929 [Rhizophagus irregularis DAOM 181602=DAOM 197198]|uniref:F-box domain-containing protein n=1 Tax=Rhizophagus irregularis (strain DAOM 181602 / DAOM 197198 / MUCL 43194) TaxID=747089 RepID=A0A2P4QEI9_RHIID|nr:hypothetical protein GLOIN_2v1474929 [Rhizophagus irregularis DAOM 181602=DAOM 197198]POG76051.1 hypothetical protein GLOIN_2v1474929 [Rhizophagus irregularis DAOM 181602=DAOM 197198]|eukprot:XP_025182917.1 hypothetical protein GLOIN_2v1474929 [Rhizophagus irregularis DAOM 181602=DAOM 197198]
MLLNFSKKKDENDVENSKTLPPELIRPIVLHLKNDKKSLHSCLLVSRDWCKETVDLLWIQPFHFLYTCNKINPSVFSLFINSKLCHCSNEKRQYQATNLLMTYLLIKHDKAFVEKGIIKAKSERITFDYFEFLFVLDLHELYCAIKDWNQWNNSNSKSNKNDYSPLTFGSIMKYFIMNIPKLKILSFDTKFIFYKINNKNPCSFLIKVDKYDDDDVNDDYNHFIYSDNYILNLLIKESKIPEITQFFANLTELVLTIRERKYEIFFSFSQICYNIQKLIIRINYPIYFYCGNAARAEVSSESYYLASLIRSQHNLVHFELFDIPEMGINEILKSLKESQHNSLKTLILNNARINYNSTILSYMKYLQNLQELRLINCICGRGIFLNNKKNKKDIFDDEKNYEEGLWLPNLKYLQVDYIDEKGEELNELSLIISSVLIRCSPLLNNGI